MKTDTFVHEAALYAGNDDFVERSSAFISEGLSLGEPVLVIVVPPKIELIRSALGRDADRVRFKDMEFIGLNPARIIPVWRDFVTDSSNGGRVRGIGEPIWSERGDDEIAEAQRHESLINLAFDGAPAAILCPYDTDALSADVIDEALRSHPTLSFNGTKKQSDMYVGLDAIAEPFGKPLPPPPRRPIEIPVTYELDAIRRFVARHAAAFGLEAGRVSDFVLAVDEVTTNTLRHTSGSGTLRTWVEGDTLIFEVSDRGRIDEPMAGREKPSADEGGFGLWIVNQVCDLVQMRSFPGGSVVRIHMRR